jgi:hypothetical protein
MGTVSLSFGPKFIENWFDLRRGGQICLARASLNSKRRLNLSSVVLGWSLPEQPPPRIYRDQSQFVGQPERICGINEFSTSAALVPAA